VTYRNTPQGFKRFLRDERVHNALIVVEFTGGYEKALTKFLIEKNLCVHRVDPKRAHHFHRSLRLKGKTDKIDAKALARYAYERHQDLIPEKSLTPEQEHLKELQARLEDLVSMRTKECNRRQSPSRTQVRKSCDSVIRFLEKEIAKINEKIEKLIDGTPELKEKKQILQTIDGIGEKVAHAVLSCLPELGKIDHKRITSLCGLAPHPKESGDYRGKRFIAKGGRSLKPFLFLAAMAARRCKNSVFYEFFHRLREKGKEKKVSLIALSRKILVIANAKIRDYEKGKQGLQVCP